MSITNLPVSTPASMFEFTDTAMANSADAVKASSTLVYWVQVDNSANGSASYVKLYNLAAGSVTVGTTVPDQTLFLPANARQTFLFNAGTANPGLTFGTALSACCVTAGGTAGTSSPSSSVIVTIAYV